MFLSCKGGQARSKSVMLNNRNIALGFCKGPERPSFACKYISLMSVLYTFHTLEICKTQIAVII